MWVQIVDFCNFILQIFKKLKRKAVCLENIFMRRSCCHFILQICKKIEQESWWLNKISIIKSCKIFLCTYNRRSPQYEFNLYICQAIIIWQKEGFPLSAKNHFILTFRVDTFFKYFQHECSLKLAVPICVVWTKSLTGDHKQDFYLQVVNVSEFYFFRTQTMLKSSYFVHFTSFYIWSID